MFVLVRYRTHTQTERETSGQRERERETDRSREERREDETAVGVGRVVGAIAGAAGQRQQDARQRLALLIFHHDSDLAQFDGAEVAGRVLGEMVAFGIDGN
jgi:hypothetical protein